LALWLLSEALIKAAEFGALIAKEVAPWQELAKAVQMTVD